MTVTYSNDIATAKFGGLVKLLFRWKGSVWKLLWKEMLVYFTLFYIIHFTFKFGMNNGQKQTFREVIAHFMVYKTVVPLSFALGFFVTIINGRWWNQYMNIPWPYGIAVYVSSTLHGYDEVGRAMRRTIMRYVCLSLTMVFRVLSKRVKERFPRMSDLIEAGLLTKSELDIIEDLEAKYPGYGKNWLPIVWAASLVNRARAEGRIKDDMAVKTLIKELNSFRGRCGNLMNYNRVNLPLVYLHVVTVGVYTYFLIALFVEQSVSIERLDNMVVLHYFPVLLILQFIIYMGWLKVAETMINPFGQDDDDFEVSYMIDRNIQMSYLIVDEMHETHPELLKDQYWNMIPKRLPDRIPNNDEIKDQQKEPNDVESLEVPKVRTNLFLSKFMSDVENPKVVQNSSVVPSSADLIPRQSIIDEHFHKIPGVVEKQSHLERAMEKIRKKNFSVERVNVDSSNSDSDDSFILTRRFKRRSTIQEFNQETLKERLRPIYGVVKKVNLSYVKSDTGDEKVENSETDSHSDSKEEERHKKDSKANSSEKLKGSQRVRTFKKERSRGSETSDEARGSTTSGRACASKSSCQACIKNSSVQASTSKISNEEAPGHKDQEEHKRSPKVSFSSNTNLKSSHQRL